MYITNIMKHNMKWAAMFVAGAAMMFACKSENKGEFTTISEGLSYQIEKENPSGQQVQEGDVLVGEMTVKFDSTVIFDTKGKVQRIAMANPNWEVKVGEGLLKMHVGEIATFALDADLMAKYLNPNQMPQNYKAGSGQKIYYRINLQDIVTRNEFMQEQSNYEENMKEMEQEEPEERGDKPEFAERVVVRIKVGVEDVAKAEADLPLHFARKSNLHGEGHETENQARKE